MSLNVYLRGQDPTLYKKLCDKCKKLLPIEYVYQANITHNLGKMAEEAGIYKHLWRPEEIDITIANQLIAPLMEGLSKLKNAPDHFRQFNDPEGWGLYKNFVPFVKKYLAACKKHPDAVIRVSR